MNKGFVSTLVMIIVALAAAKYFFGWSIFDAAASQEGQGTVVYIRKVLDTIWHYIGFPVTWTWNAVLEPLVDLGWEKLKEKI